MQKTRQKSNKFNWLIEKLKRFSEWRGGLAVTLILLLLALLSRTVNLSSFPYFPPNKPWNGVNGLYVDESYISLFTPSNTVYFPFLQISLMDIVINALGYSIFSIRLVSALFSSITCVLVYHSACELFNRKLPAVLSSLFFIFMTPALVFGRMALVENGATTFFVATFLFALKYLKTSKNVWLASSAISAGLSFLSKQTGLVATVFLVLVIFIHKPKAERQLLKALTLTGLIASTYFIQILIVNPFYVGNLSLVSVGLGNVSWISTLLFNLMPSGANIMWIESSLVDYKGLFNFLALDFWYLVALFVIVYLLVNEKEKVLEVILAISSYALVMILVGHANSYYTTLVQPFLAIPFGYGMLKLINMSAMFSSAFALLLCFPAISYINYYLSTFLIMSTVNTAWTAIQLALTLVIIVGLAARIRQIKIKKGELSVSIRVLLMYYVAWAVIGIYFFATYPLNPILMIIQFTVAVPILVMGIMRLIYEESSGTEAILTNRFLILFFISSLIVGSYLLPVFYPGYFAQSTVPI